MAQAIKYNTGAKTANCCIKKGNYDIGVIQNYAYGPTSSSDFYAGYTIPSPGGFVSYQNKASQGPSIYSIPSVNDLVAFGENLNIGSQTTPEDVIYACATTTDIALVNIDYIELPSINNNILTLDAGYTASYPWKNSDWFDISGNENSGVLTGDTSFVSGTSVYNYSNSYLNMPSASQNAMALVPNFGSQLNTFTVNIFINLINGQGFDLRQNVIGQQGSVNSTPTSECNFLIRGNGTNGYEGVIRSVSNEYTVSFGAVSTGNHMLTLTYDGNQMGAYLDGSQVAINNIGAIVSMDNGLQTVIGGNVNASINEGSQTRYFDGRIYVVNIYDIALNSGEITTLFGLYQTQRGF
jgi:hypothetical protein